MIQLHVSLTFVVFLCFCASSECLQLLNQARCQAFCLTQFSGKIGGAPATECSNTDCKKCMQPCTAAQSNVQDCSKNCASDACKASCAFIAKLGDEASFTEHINPPGIPAVKQKNFTSILLSWKKPDNSSNEAVVYLVEMKYSGDLNRNWKTLKMIIAKTYAEVTQTNLCKTIVRFYDPYRRPSFNGIDYQFRIVAVSKNSSAVRSMETGVIQLPRPETVKNVSFNILHFNDSRGDKLYFFGKWLPTDLARSYFVRWEHNRKLCYQGHSFTPVRTWKGSEPNITVNVPHKQKNGCPNTFTVYVLIGCSLSLPVTVKVVNQGCRHIPHYPVSECCKVHHPTLGQANDLIVRNLKRSSLSVTKDFKYSFNITWDSPVYFEQTGCQALQKNYRIQVGDPSKKKCSFFGCYWGTFKSLQSNQKMFEVKDISEGNLYKFQITTTGFRIYTLGNTKTQINFTVGPSPEELKVKKLSVVFSENQTSTRTNISWSEPTFNSGFLMSYVIAYGGSQRKIPANVTSFVIEETQLTSTLAVKVKPLYSHKGFAGIVTETEASPNSNKYKVRNLHRAWKDQALLVSWEKPQSNSKVKQYIVDYKIRPQDSNVTKAHTAFLNYTISWESATQPKAIVFKITPEFEDQHISGAATSSKADFDDKCIVTILSSRGEKQKEKCLNDGVCYSRSNDYNCKCTKEFTGKNCEIGVRDTQVTNLKSQRVEKDQLRLYWDKLKTQAEVKYYEVSYKIRKSAIVEEKSVNTPKTLFYEFMTPQILNRYAIHINKDHTLTALQLTFNAGTMERARLLRIPLIPPGKLSRRMPLTVKIVVGLDTNIGGASDSDISNGITDGVDFHGFVYPDQLNYGTHAPCFGRQGKSGLTLSSITSAPSAGLFTGKKYPGQAVITLKPTEQWGSCYTAHDGGFLNYMQYKSHLDLAKGIFFEAYKGNTGERVGIKYIEVTVIQSF